MGRLRPILLVLTSLLLLSDRIYAISQTNATNSDDKVNKFSTEKQTSSTLGTTTSPEKISFRASSQANANKSSILDVAEIQSDIAFPESKRVHSRPVFEKENGSSGWKGFAGSSNGPLDTNNRNKHISKGSSLNSQSSPADPLTDFQDIHKTSTSIFPLPPIFRPKNPNDKPALPDILFEDPATYLVTTTTTTPPPPPKMPTTPAIPASPYYSYFKDLLTETPAMTTAEYLPNYKYGYATNPTTKAPYVLYTYTPPVPRLPVPLKTYSSNAISGKSYGGSSSSYGSMGMGMGGPSPGMTGATSGTGGYDTPYMQQMPMAMSVPTGGGMMYSSGMYGAAGSAPGAAAGAGMMAYPSYAMTPPAKEESSLKGFINKLLAFLPIGLLLAVALPSLVVVPSRRSLDTTNGGGSAVNGSHHGSYPMLDMIDYYGIDSLQDENCFHYILCKTVRLGSQHGANVYQEKLWAAINWMDAALAKNMGMERLWTAILEDQCATFSCTKNSTTIK